jgi:hypothetical protein
VPNYNPQIKNGVEKSTPFFCSGIRWKKGFSTASTPSAVARKFQHIYQPSSFPRTRESSPGSPTAGGIPGKNWMPAFACMTLPYLYVVLLGGL